MDTYPTLGKGKIIFKMAFLGDMLVSWRVLLKSFSNMLLPLPAGGNPPNKTPVERWNRYGHLNLAPDTNEVKSPHVDGDTQNIGRNPAFTSYGW